MFDTDTSKPTAEILNDIRSCLSQSHMPGLPLLPLGVLLSKVAGETGETIADLKSHITDLNRQNARSQSWVVVLAIAALVGTFVQTAIAVLAYTNQPRPSESLSATGIKNPQDPITANPEASKIVRGRQLPVGR